MRDILFLAHRLPYPPDKGDKIRAWHILQYLASHYRVHLGAFIDRPDDVRHVARLQTLCASVFWRPLSLRLAGARTARALLTGKSLTEGYFGDARFGAEVDRVVARHKPGLVYAFSSSMAPYALRHRQARIILDMVDVDSEKWRQYARESRWPLRWVYSREGLSLLALEQEAAAKADAVILVTPAEAELFSALCPDAAPRVHCIGNGVDADYFDPSRGFPNPFGERPAIVFTGAMDYRPNVEAMVWFVDNVVPRLRRRHGAAPCLWIVGSSPNATVRALAGPDVRVTARVPDVRPYLRHARAVVVPLQIARGIQNKALEAMAMGAVLIVTPQVRRTLSCCRDDELHTAATPGEFADAIFGALDADDGQMGTRARQRVLCDYRWDRAFAALDNLIAMGSSGRIEAADVLRAPASLAEAPG
jgi:sugar transferase (PEP-CTERM/EpsH1 system associated)